MEFLAKLTKEDSKSETPSTRLINDPTIVAFQIVSSLRPQHAAVTVSSFSVDGEAGDDAIILAAEELTTEAESQAPLGA
ncbi:unnamed protein product [Taenia asiatica]|uniref:Uncharacterized protein n=1 Tax=Taenia asiatica TaxID=60517 RepID=A0A3P6R7W6_TAEAS|nr:unnamed protein product [Taenia asiatica]